MRNIISQDKFESLVKDWLSDRKKNTSDFNVNSKTDLIDSRIIDSLDFVEFILFIEEICGYNISSKVENSEPFRSIESIYNTFIHTK